MKVADHYVVEIKVTRVDFETVDTVSNTTIAERERQGLKKRITDEVAHFVIKNKNLPVVKNLAIEHLKLVDLNDSVG